jgi:hypothetical protein
MPFNSYTKICIFIGVLFLIGYLVVIGFKKKSNKVNSDNSAFIWLLGGMFIGIVGDVTLLRYPIMNYPEIKALINPTFFTFLFFSLPVIGGLLGILTYSLLLNKNK